MLASTMSTSTDEQRARVTAAIDAGTLALDPQAGSFVDLIHEVAARSGASAALPSGTERSRQRAAVRALLPEAETLVFVIVDGLGAALLERSDGFLRDHVAGELSAVFPSTTACAMTSVATATWPADHGIPGWWAFLDEHHLSATVLPFIERYSGESLVERAVAPADLWPGTSWSGSLGGRVHVVIPERFTSTTFSAWQLGGILPTGYRRLSDLPRLVADAAADPGVDLVYVYLPEYDSTCHEYGVTSPEAEAALRAIDRRLEELAATLAGDTAMVVTADHGLIDVVDDDRRILRPGDPLLELLEVPPTGDARVPQFHVRPGRDQAFRDRFEERFGAEFLLLDRDAADELRMFGPAPMTPLAVRRFGTHCAIPTTRVALWYLRGRERVESLSRGLHAGPDSAEMRIPVIALAGDAISGGPGTAGA